MPKLAGVNHLDAVRALEKAGFWIARQGKHIVMTDGTRVLILTAPRIRSRREYELAIMVSFVLYGNGESGLSSRQIAAIIRRQTVLPRHPGLTV